MEGSFFFALLVPGLCELDQSRLGFLDVNLEAVPGVVYDYNPALGVNLDCAGMSQTLLVARVVGVSKRPLPNHVRVGGQLVPAHLESSACPWNSVMYRPSGAKT